VLKPTEFQEFELEEKTVLSHNTAMYAPLIIDK
jgi:cytochrome-b5 reductase